VIGGRRAAVLMALLFAATAACGVAVDGSARIVPEEEVPFDLLSRTTTTLAAGAEQGQDTSICLALNGSLLAVGRDRGAGLPLDTPTSLALAGPTEGEAELGLRSAVDELSVNDVTVEGDTAVVELAEDFLELPGGEQLLAVAQLTCTLTSQPGTTRVTFLLEGEPVEVPTQTGSIVARPVTRADYGDLIAN
jgi:hypothetical protein